MGDSHSFAALDWVIEEIDSTLKQASQALEAFVSDPEDSTRIRFCLTHLHQVHGSLSIVEFRSAANLALEMELLAQALMSGECENTADAHQILMQAILQLPIYLDQIKTSRRENPLIIQSLMNDLRVVRGEELVSSKEAIEISLAPASQIQGERVSAAKNSQQFSTLVEKLRQMYQVSANGLIRGVKLEENTGYLYKVFSRLYKLTQGSARQSVWDISLALLEGVAKDSIEHSVSVKTLLKELHKEIKLYVVKGNAVLDTEADEELLTHLLYYVAGADGEGAHLGRIKDLYELQNVIPKGLDLADLLKQQNTSVDLDALRSVVSALKEELNSVKDILESPEMNEDASASLLSVAPILSRIADTMMVLDVEDLRENVIEQVALIESLAADPTGISNEVLLAIAGKIITVEASLDALVGVSARQDEEPAAPTEGHVELAYGSVLRESKKAIEQAKDAIVEYISSQWDPRQLDNVPHLLSEVRGGLDLMHLSRPASIVSACANYVESSLIESDEQPEWSKLELLADAVSAVEYYLENYSVDPQNADQLLLSGAEQCLSGLGFRFPETDLLPPDENAATEVHIEELNEGEIEPSSTIIEEPVEDIESSEGSGDHFETIESLAEDSLEQPVIEALTGANAEVEAEVDTSNAEVEIGLEAEGDSGVEEKSSDAESEIAHETVDAEKQEADAEVTELEVEPEIVESREEEFAPDGEESDSEDSDIDEEIIEIFIEEAGEVCETIAEFLPVWADNLNNADALTEVRRAFHTVKGSGRMVGASEPAELAWTAENLLNKVIEGSVERNNHVSDFLADVHAHLPELVQAFEQQRASENPELTEKLMSAGASLAAGELPASNESVAVEASAAEESTSDEHLSSVHEEASEPSIELGELSLDEEHEKHEEPSVDALVESDPASLVEALVSESQEPIEPVELESAQENSEPLESELLQEPSELSEPEEPLDDSQTEDGPDLVLWEIFSSEAETHLETIEQFIAEMDEAAPLYSPPSDATQRALHTLKGSAHMAGVAAIAQMATPLELFAKELRSYQVDITPDILQLLRDSVEYTRDALAQMAEGQEAEVTQLPQFIARLSELKELSVGYLIRQQEAAEKFKAVDPQLLSIFMAEEMDLLLDADVIIDEWEKDPAKIDSLVPLNNELATLAEGAERANLPEMAQLAKQLGGIYDGLAGGLLGTDSAMFASLKEGHNALLDMVDAIAAGQNIQPCPDEVMQNLKDLLAIPDIENTLNAEAEAEAPVVLEDDEEDFDPEIVEIFVEEAEELLDEIDQSIHNWKNDWSNNDSPEELKRTLHTLKGGARLAGLMGFGELAHNFESHLIELDQGGELNDAFFKDIQSYQDLLLNSNDRIKANELGDEEMLAEHAPQINNSTAVIENANPSPEIETIEEAAKPEETSSVPEDSKESSPSADILPFAPKAKPAPVSPILSATVSDNPVPQTPAAAVAAPRNTPQEVVKVSAELLEDLVNLAGETSISRGRMEEQVSELGYSIEEMDTTIKRLQEQLRRLDIETEAQMVFRQEQLAEHEDFDPLEMDRYSMLQQLSRSLTESASDLLDLKSTLLDKTRDTETLLLQQSRINTDLQEGLMRSRMVPFSRLVPRLRRIVRQISGELNKQVNFNLENVEGELDRSMLERMVAPLEHMLRNAVDHGIEDQNERKKAGKPDTGNITLTLGREGADVIIRLRDDGRGIDLERVKAKALERGLMNENSTLGDLEIMQFILHAGFSTAEKVTQISGRGVGMDVVHSEIKQMGGNMQIVSQQGLGTEFAVRLPFTVSVNRALMVQIGDDRFAIPLNSIEGIVRVSPFELEHYYDDLDARFEYAGQNYQVRYLGEMLNTGSHPKLEGQVLPLPVVLVRSNDQAIALQVDSLMGSREIVVKTLGSQFSNVAGLSGATVMGDGSVVVILDPHAMVRQELVRQEGDRQDDAQALLARQQAAVPTILVVDDSVTVRKVTTRFLEREGYIVHTAKDGVDALAQLQDLRPDLMLLDIEMPRMDGFEVAKNVRSSSVLKDLPIIMITSRTGDKHREHAFSLGVNQYMGKPYQEEVLISGIQELLEGQTE